MWKRSANQPARKAKQRTRCCAYAESQKPFVISMIAKRFSGNFGIPVFIHATMPPRVETMKRLNKRISYLLETPPEPRKFV